MGCKNVEAAKPKHQQGMTNQLTASFLDGFEPYSVTFSMELCEENGNEVHRHLTTTQSVPPHAEPNAMTDTAPTTSNGVEPSGPQLRTHVGSTDHCDFPRPSSSPAGSTQDRNPHISTV
jgi:hypothetical protein